VQVGWLKLNTDDAERCCVHVLPCCTLDFHSSLLLPLLGSRIFVKCITFMLVMHFQKKLFVFKDFFFLKFTIKNVFSSKLSPLMW